jgi:signal transduction histidine kinase
MVDPVPTFVADEVYLKAALIQLLDNAVKFSAPDRAITMGAHVVNGEVCLWIQDQGRGIDEGEQEHIWETFYQVDRRRYEDPGTGSGLAIVESVAKLHGGRAEVDSKLGQGSRFSLFIPLEPQAKS